MKEFMNQHGETVLAGTAAALVISSFAGMAFGGGFSRIEHIFSSGLRLWVLPLRGEDVISLSRFTVIGYGF